MIAAVLLLVPFPASGPQRPAYFVRVDFVVVNHCRSCTTEYDAWGRPAYTPRCTVWISYYDWLIPQRGLPVLQIPVGWINRGWTTPSRIRCIAPCTQGWLIETTDGINVITPLVFVVSSPYDWEMRNRKLFRPIKKP